MLSSPELRGFKDRLRRDGKALQTVKAPPVAFKALLSVAPPFDPATELGSDPREKSICELLSPGPDIKLNDYVTETGTQNKWQVVWRDNNTADFTVKYTLAAVIAEDET